MFAWAAGVSKTDEIGTDGKAGGEKTYEIINRTEYFIWSDRRRDVERGIEV